MKINISHCTEYVYSETVPKLIQCVKLYPSICKNQQILNWKISASHGKIVESHIDALGHKILNIYNNNFSGKLKISSSGEVKTKNLSGIISGLKEKVNPLCFLRQTDLTRPCKKIKEISEDKKLKALDMVEYAHQLNLIVSNCIEYVSGSTSTSTSSKQALKQGKGVCQDFAHILISVARYKNLPARYVNGFLLETTNSGENTTHAWTEIFLKELGWVGFDPSHKKCIDDKYVRVSTGLDFLDASTIKGIKINYTGKEYLHTTVKIRSDQ
tara:strand:+ start:420 stop:1229 length:810 start_codon:yes stop_codon:yes gene_type:complete